MNALNRFLIKQVIAHVPQVERYRDGLNKIVDHIGDYEKFGREHQAEIQVGMQALGAVMFPHLPAAEQTSAVHTIITQPEKITPAQEDSWMTARERGTPG